MDDQVIATTAKVLGNPVRVAIIRDSVGWGEEGMSPNRWSQKAGLELSNVAYHFKTLIAADALVLREAVPRRGALEHFYRPGPAADFLRGAVRSWAKS